MQKNKQSFAYDAMVATQPFLVSLRNAPPLWGGALGDDTEKRLCSTKFFILHQMLYLHDNKGITVLQKLKV